jgi:hypothetical protein
MTPLREALNANQQRALNAVGKAYVAGHIETREAVAEQLLSCGITDQVEIAYLLGTLDVLKQWGVPASTENGQKPQAQSDPASDAQWNLIRKLADEKGTTAPDVPLTKAKASEVIDALQKGTYKSDDYEVPF